MEKSSQREITRGLVSGIDHSVIPNGSWISAIGVVVSGDDNTEPFISREHGTELCLVVPKGYRLRGHVYTNNGYLICLLSNNTEFQIIKIFPDCKTEVLVKDDCLKITSFVDMTYRTREGCKDVIYFTDCENPVMSINLSNLDCYKINGKYDCSLFELFRAYNIPCIDSAEVISSGGNVRYGSYNIGIQYLDSDLNPTSTTYSSSIVTVSESLGGAYNFDTNPLIGRKISNKSIKWQFSNLDNRFPYYRLIIVEYSSGSGQASEYYATDKISINNTIYVFSGLNDSLVKVSENEINTINLYYRAKYIDQIEDRLILSNLKGSPYKYCDWQKYASKIKVSWVYEELDANKYISKGLNTGVWDNTFLADEVYAASIVYVDIRGNHHFGFHIPGTPINTDIDCNKLPTNIPNCREIDLFVCIDPLVYDSNGTRIINDISVTYFVNNKKRTKVVHIDEYYNKDNNSEFKYLLESVCSTDSVRFEKLEYVANTEYTLRLSSKALQSIFYDPVIPPLNGWDDTVYPEWNSDMEHLISEERYKEIISIYNSTASKKIIYGNYSKANLELLKNVNSLPKRYEIYNTASRNGRLSYHQCKYATYINPTKGCCDDYYGVDYCGNKLDGTPIRHIKMPDRSLIPLFAKGKLRRLGLKFENIDYPHKDIVGHYIVIGKRKDSDKTIIDKGIARTASFGDPEAIPNVWGFSYWEKQLTNTNIMTYVSPSMLLGNNSLRGTYMKDENIYTYHPLRLDTVLFDGKGIGAIDKDIEIDARQIDHKESISSKGHNYYIKDQLVLESNSKTTYDDFILANMSLLSNMGYIVLNNIFQNTIPPNVHSFTSFDVARNANSDRFGSGLQIPNYLNYVSIKVNNDPYCSLDNIEYIRTHDCIHNKYSVIWGNTYMTKMDFTSLIIRESYNLFSGFLEATGISSLFDVDGIKGLVEDGAFDQLAVLTNFIAFSGEVMSSWVECEYNWQLRSFGNTHETSIYRHLFTNGRRSEALFVFFIDKLLEEKKGTFDIYYSPRNLFIKEFYSYNKDYSIINCQSKYYPIPSTYDFCSECTELFPNRSIYSERSFSDEQIDNYKIFKANNFIDIPSDNGDITDIFTDGNDLYAHTTDGLWKFIYGYQETIRNNIVTFIGDGSFFPRPPVKVINSYTGHAGSLHRHSTIKTPEGVIFVDELSHNVYLINGGISSIIEEHREFFINNLKSYLRSKIPNHNYDDAYNLATYDEINRRYILTKRDKLPLLEGSYRYYKGQYYYEDIPISIEDPKYFKDIGFTISYSFKRRMWISYHQYWPDYYLYNKDIFLSAVGEIIHSHNSVYYNNIYDKDTMFAIDVPVSTGLHTKTINDIIVYMSTKKIVGSKFVDVKEFFDKIVAYNDWQTSGEREISTDNTHNSYVSNKYVIATRNDRNWHLNTLIDLCVNPNISFFECFIIRDGMFIDREHNNSAIDTKKEWTDIEPFVGDNMFVRFILTGKKDVNFIMKSIINTESLNED